jgi:hypothetical protein
MRKFAAPLLLLVGLARVTAAPLAAQSSAQAAPLDFFSKWELRATATQAKQPQWMIPAVSPFPMLIQVFRADFSREISPTQTTIWNYGASRGVNLIPFARTEVDILVPPFFEHSNATPAANQNGFGDFSFTGKYRILSANEQQGNYLLSAFITTTIPTGSYKNGTTNATLTPTLGGGKGFGRFDAFTTLGGTLPTGNTATIGRSIASNTTFQYHVQKYLWPEFEINTTAWYGGAKDGKVQTFLTPGLMFGKYAPYGHESGATKSRVGFAAGAAFQTASTTYHTYNHSLVVTSRITF